MNERYLVIHVVVVVVATRQSRFRLAVQCSRFLKTATKLGALDNVKVNNSQQIRSDIHMSTFATTCKLLHYLKWLNSSSSTQSALQSLSNYSLHSTAAPVMVTERKFRKQGHKWLLQMCVRNGQVASSASWFIKFKPAAAAALLQINF